VYKADHVIGLPVFDLSAGQELGLIRDILLDKDLTFQGLLLETKGLFRRGRYIPSTFIHAIGEDCVTITDQARIAPLPEPNELIGIASSALKGKSIVTEDGRFLGLIEDVYLQDEIGKIAGYEVSDGLLSDLMDGRKMVRHKDGVTIGEDAVVIPAE
jgi:uncharacterized protein YrrD